MILHHQYLLLKYEDFGSPQVMEFTVPLYDPKPSYYNVRIHSERWLGSESYDKIDLEHIVLPESFPPQTDLLNLQPLPVKALKNSDYESLYKFSHFNPIQTQVFHNVYHSDHNILLGSPTGSGKTIVAEMAMLRLFSKNPKAKIIYVAPLKALVRERIIAWEKTFVQLLGKNMVELTGDFTPDVKLLHSADIVVTTPEKWDGISRNWKKRSYVQQVGLVILDEIHLLGEDRGPIIEVIVSRMRYIAWSLNAPIRLLGLSATLANAHDVADWFGIEKKGLYNFRQSVRPVPLTSYIQGFPGKHYCPRMATMNKPIYSSILSHSKNKPVLIFVSSRRQTRLTALDLISFCSVDENPYQFVRMSTQELKKILSRVTDTNLRHTLVFGIGIHHAGLNSTDKSLVEHLFVTEKIQLLVCTSTLAWGVNFPSHLVVIKGTEYFDPATKKYVDYPIADGI
jgi:activating signal cointegrator complex subunit 3